MAQQTWGRKVSKTIQEINEETKEQKEKFEDKLNRLSKKI